jgi:ATP-dependent protease ClpP protease subunit
MLDDQMLSRLSPQILKLQSQSRAPITVYVLNSPGGQTAAMQGIIRLLKLADQDGTSPCHVITVVTNKAQSAAADLVSAGDYSIAFPSSMLLYHGVRTPMLIPTLQPFTAERTSLLAHILRLTNDAYAMDLARKAEKRFLLRFMILYPEFKDVRDAVAPKTISDLDCFVTLLSQRLSAKAIEVLQKAQERYRRYEPLMSKLLDKASKQSGPAIPAHIEAQRIKAIVNFEVSSNKRNKGWTFKDGGGLTRVVEDFFLMAEYLENQQSDRLEHWCLTVGKMSLSKSEQETLNQIADEKARNEQLIKTVRPIIQPVWMFFIALCHALQEDDNELTAVDAYWFGLVDEVWGNATLVASRWFEEFEADQQPSESDDKETKSGDAKEKPVATGA